VKRVLPTESEYSQIRSAIKEQLAAVDWLPDDRLPVMLGTGGTLRAALKLARELFGLPADSQEFKAAHVKVLLDRLGKENDNIYLAVYRIIPERLMTVFTGLAILQQVVKRFGCERISVSKFGVREGYLIERVLKGGAEGGPTPD
jgi:exopolyphosphatase/guanosine-5'-triphosphate,3'-diphosphate pyrophosphatase